MPLVVKSSGKTFVIQICSGGPEITKAGGLLKRIVITTAVTEQSTRHLKNWLHGWAQKVWLKLHTSAGDWLQVQFHRDLHWDLLVMFSTFISGLEDVKEYSLSKFGDEAKLVAPVNTLGDIQRDPDQH